MTKGKGYYSKASRAARSAAYKTRIETRRLMSIGAGFDKRKYVRSGKYKGRSRKMPKWMRAINF